MKVFLLTLSLLVFFSLSSFAFAQTQSPSPTVKQAREDFMKARQDLKVARLDNRKLKVCQTKEKVIKNRLASLTRLVANQEEKFSKILTRVETFYTTKGKTVTNYDALVANIATKKTVVDANLATAKTDSDNFVCTSDNPKGELTQFKTDMQAVKSALKDYRTSIKNLIVAVKGVVGEENESPEPTKTP